MSDAITIHDVNNIIGMQLVSDGTFLMEEGEPELRFPEPFYYNGNPETVLTHANFIPYVKQLALIANVVVQYRLNDTNGEIEASIHHYRKKLETEGIKIDLTDENAMDKTAQELGFRTWSHIPKGALDGQWIDPDPFASFESSNWLEVNFMVCMMLGEMTEFKDANSARR